MTRRALQTFQLDKWQGLHSSRGRTLVGSFSLCLRLTLNNKEPLNIYDYCKTIEVQTQCSSSRLSWWRLRDTASSKVKRTTSQNCRLGIPRSCGMPRVPAWGKVGVESNSRIDRLLQYRTYCTVRRVWAGMDWAPQLLIQRHSSWFRDTKTCAVCRRVFPRQKEGRKSIIRTTNRQ